jgi:hypothetical protein
MKKSKYYSGPGGVFYGKKRDNIFILEWTWGHLVNVKTFKMTGRLYDYYALGVKHKNIAVIDCSHDWIRLGDL